MTDGAMTWEGLCPLGPECPFPSDPDWHIPHCQHGLIGHHHHCPPRSQGGKRIAAFICPDCHRKVGEKRYGDVIKQADDGTEHYILWAKKGGRVIVDRVIGRWQDEAAGDESAPTLPLPAPATFPDQPLRVKYLPTGLEFPEDLTYEEWARVGVFLGQLVHALPFQVGDWLKQGQWRWGEKYAQAASETGLKEERLQQYQWVAEHVEPIHRVQKLSWSHHREVADKQPEEQREWLQRAQDEGMTANELRLALKGPVPPDVCPDATDGEHDWRRVCRHCGKER